MARAANQKLKCLYLWQFLLQNTDEEHPDEHPQRPPPADEDRHNREYHGHPEGEGDHSGENPLTASRGLLHVSHAHTCSSVTGRRPLHRASRGGRELIWRHHGQLWVNVGEKVFVNSNQL